MVNFLKAVTGNSKSTVRRGSTDFPKLGFESLEDRRMLATFTVTNATDGPVAAPGDLPGSLRQAIFDANANSGADTISFSGLFNTQQTIELQSELAVTDAVTITGPGQDLITLDAGNGDDNVFSTGDGHRIFNIDDDNSVNEINVTLSGLTLTGGDAADGIDFGFGNGGDGDNGGAIQSSENLTVTDSTISGNASGDGGTGVGNGGNGGEAAGSGGDGGGIFNSGTLTLTGSTISGNVAGGGGYASYYDADGFFEYGFFGLDGDGGGISSVGTLTVTNSTVSGNETGTSGYLGNGGGISSSGTLTVTNSEISSNTAGYDGGGISVQSGSVTLTNSSVSGNQSSVDGGGIEADSADLTLINSSVSGNTANRSGGGIRTNGGDVTLTNSTVSGNRALGTFGGGGGISSSNRGNVTLTNSTVSGNTANFQGGGIQFIVFSGNSLTVHNSIIAGNLDNGTAPDLRASLNSGGVASVTVRNSVIGNTTGTSFFAGSNNQLNVDFTTVLETEVVDGVTVPRLHDNGGVVETIALLADSPAIDAGNNALAVDANGNSLLTDQRGAGFDRIVSGTVDIGAFEFGNAVVGTAPMINSIVRDEGGVLARPDLISTYAVTFDQDVSVSQDDLFIFNETLGTSIDSSSVTLSYDSGSQTATWSFGSLVLAPAFYSFELSSDISGVAGGMSLDGNGDGVGGDSRSEEVYVAIPGDANLDGQVNVLGDAFALVANLGTTGGATWAQGDFNADGIVNVLGDAFTLVANLGESVLPPVSAIANPVTVSPSPLLNQQVVSVVDDSEDEQAVQVGTAAAPVLAGSQLLDAAFAADDWLI